MIYFSNSPTAEGCDSLFALIAHIPTFIANTLSWRCVDTDHAAFIELMSLPCWNDQVKPGVPVLVIRRPGAERGIHIGATAVVHMLKQRIGRKI